MCSRIIKGFSYSKTHSDNLAFLFYFNNLSNYKRCEKVGEGTYGIVYKAKYRPTNEFVTLKKIWLCQDSRLFLKKKN